MNLGLPNDGAAPNRRLRFGTAPWSFGFFMSPGSAVGELGRSAGSGRPVCKHSVEAGRESSSTADARRLTQILSCVSRDSRLHSQRSDIAGGHCVSAENEGPEILE